MNTRSFILNIFLIQMMIAIGIGASTLGPKKEIIEKKIQILRSTKNHLFLFKIPLFVMGLFLSEEAWQAWKAYRYNSETTLLGRTLIASIACYLPLEFVLLRLLNNKYDSLDQQIKELQIELDSEAQSP